MPDELDVLLDGPDELGGIMLVEVEFRVDGVGSPSVPFRLSLPTGTTVVDEPDKVDGGGDVVGIDVNVIGIFLGKLEDAGAGRAGGGAAGTFPPSQPFLFPSSPSPLPRLTTYLVVPCGCSYKPHHM